MYWAFCFTWICYQFIIVKKSFPDPLKRRISQIFFFLFFSEDEDDEEMVEPKAQDDLEIENQDQKQEVKEGTLKNEKHDVRCLKDWILPVVILVSSFHY